MMKMRILVFVTLLLLLHVPAVAQTSPYADVPMISGFHLGCQSWSFNRFSVMEAIEKTAQAGGVCIEFYPGQRLSNDQRDTGFGPNLSEADIASVKAQLVRYKIRPVAFGVNYLGKDETQNRKLFAFCKKMGIPTITCEPDPAAMGGIEKLVQEYDIRVAIHNHPRRNDDPNYKNWNPDYVLSLVKNLDRRIGSCADIGHWVRSGIKPTDALKKLRGRVLGCHMKDLNVFAPEGHDVPFGTGVSDIATVLTELRRQKYDGPISIEYEYNWDNNVPDIAQSVGFVRGYGR